MSLRTQILVFVGAAVAACVAAHAQPDPSGIEFVTIGAPGNAPYRSANPDDLANGRGGVAYEYRIGRFEVTTAQWVAFFNAAYDRPADDRIPHLLPPDHWGAVPTTPNTPGGRRWRVPAGNEMLPVGDISWRMAAIFCNWQHNSQALNREAFLSGAYDVSTFGFNGGIFTDQLERSPGARFFVPSWDEWLKASHYSPTRDNGDGTIGGWWMYSNGSDTPYVYGPPGVGQANAGFLTPSPFSIPLGAYSAMTPWGLMDAAGGATEWTEGVRTLAGGDRYRVFEGSFWTLDRFTADLVDRINERGEEYPNVPTFEFGFRIASIVPAPLSCAPVVGVLLILDVRRKRRES